MPTHRKNHRAQGLTKLWYPQMGVVMSAAEFGLTFPGTYNVDYSYPVAAECDYYKGKYLKVMRLLFRWERMQPTLGGTLDAAELGRMDTFITAAWSRGIQVWPACGNFGGYRTGNYGSTDPGPTFKIAAASGPTQAQFADFWGKMASHYSGNPAIYGYGLMGEPRNMPTLTTWPAAAQAAVNSIRTADTQTPIIVCGDDNGAAAGWTNTTTSNNNSFALTDPTGNNNIVYEAHCYFDQFWSGDYSDTYAIESASFGVTASTGANMLNTFGGWLAARGYRGIIGEWGVPHNVSGWYPCATNFMIAARAANIPTMLWGGGPWWGNWNTNTIAGNNTTLEPMGGPGSYTDAPTMAVYESYATIANQAPP